MSNDGTIIAGTHSDEELAHCCCLTSWVFCEQAAWIGNPISPSEGIVGTAVKGRDNAGRRLDPAGRQSSAAISKVDSVAPEPDRGLSPAGEDDSPTA